MKWTGKKSVMLLGSNFDNIVSKPNVMGRQKSSLPKISVNCRQEIKTYSTIAYLKLTNNQHDRRSKSRFYLRLFFDLLDDECLNSFFV